MEKDCYLVVIWLMVENGGSSPLVLLSPLILAHHMIGRMDILELD